MQRPALPSFFNNSVLAPQVRSHPELCWLGCRLAKYPSMKRKRCCLVPFGLLVLAFADGFGNRFAAFKQQNRSSRRGRGGGVSLLTEEGRDGDSRIDPDPGALEEWVSRLGGAIGPVVLEGGRLRRRISICCMQHVIMCDQIQTGGDLAAGCHAIRRTAADAPMKIVCNCPRGVIKRSYS